MFKLPETSRQKGLRFLNIQLSAGLQMKVKNTLSLCKIEIINLSGQTVYQKLFTGTPGKQNIGFDASKWDSGVYFMRVTQNNKVQVEKIIKN